MVKKKKKNLVDVVKEWPLSMLHIIEKKILLNSVVCRDFFANSYFSIYQRKQFTYKIENITLWNNFKFASWTKMDAEIISMCNIWIEQFYRQILHCALVCIIWREGKNSFWASRSQSSNSNTNTSCMTIMCRNDELSWLFTNRFSATM